MEVKLCVAKEARRKSNIEVLELESDPIPSMSCTTSLQKGSALNTLI